MIKTLFDLDRPVEKAVYNRLLEYFDMNVTHDEVLSKLGEDFPFLDSNLRDTCESAVFMHYEMLQGDQDGMIAEFKEMIFKHSSKADSPYYSNTETMFHISDDEDVLVTIMIENKHFLYRTCDIHYSIYLDDIKVNEFKHKITDLERRNTYTIPLNIIKCRAMEEKNRKKFKVKVVDELIKGREYYKTVEIFHGPKGALDVLDLYYKELSLEGSALNIRCGISYDGTYDEIPFLEAVATLSPCGSSDNLLDHQQKFGIFERYDCPNDFTTDVDILEDRLKSGTYDFKLSIWNNEVWNSKIEIDTESMEFSILEDSQTETLSLEEVKELQDMDDFFSSIIEEMELKIDGELATGITLSDDQGKTVTTSEGDVIRYEGEPSVLTLRLLFSHSYACKKDLSFKIVSPDTNINLVHELSYDEIIKIKGEIYEVPLSIKGVQLKDKTRLHLTVSTKEGQALMEDKFILLKFNNPYEVLDIAHLHLYKLSETDEQITSTWLDFGVKKPKTAFESENLTTLTALCIFNNVKDIDWTPYRNHMTWRLFDQNGRVIDTDGAEIEYVNERYSAYVNFCSNDDYKWEQGGYEVELSWFDIPLFCAKFKVGNKDMDGEYDPAVIKRKPVIIKVDETTSALDRLEKMAGLEKIKEKVRSFINYSKLQKKRAAAGLPVKQPSLHARFLGNPGTGKTTVAKLLGQIYKELGLLSSGHVVVEERKNMLGKYYDSESTALAQAIERAQGGILLIDEAYNLYVEGDDKDPGKRILEYLLTELSDESKRDWMLILAGYPKEMERMLDSNPGIKSRISDVFTFEDFDVDTLVQIGELYCSDNEFVMTPEAKERLRAIITKEMSAKDKHFGNGRYVNKLIESAINTRMADRLSEIEDPTREQLITIEADDIPISQKEAERISKGSFDEEAINKALTKLDSLVGLKKVKSAIHNFVKVARFLNSQGEKFTGKGLLKWNFTGNTGTGKSTVAKILADILKAMNLIQNNEVKEVKGEEIFNVSDYECNEVLKEAVKKANNGMLHIDADAPEFMSGSYRMTNEQVKLKLGNLSCDGNSTGAVVISECQSPQMAIAQSLAGTGVYDYDHTFIFDDYSEDELYQILIRCLEKYEAIMSEEAEAVIREFITRLCCNRELGFANARTMKHLSRAIFDVMVLRISNSAENDTKRIILGCDVESFVWKNIGRKIGF